jgi:hypothetical protein
MEFGSLKRTGRFPMCCNHVGYELVFASGRFVTLLI